MSDIESRLIEDVERYGFSVISVPGESSGSNFSYTVGLAVSCHHSDFVIAGLPQDVAVQVLGQIARLAIEGRVFSEGDRTVDVLEGREVLIGPVNRDFIADSMSVAVNFSGVSFRGALQVIWPDRNDNYPGDEGYDPGLSDRQILG